MRSASSRCGWVGAVLLLVTASAVDVAADAPKFDLGERDVKACYLGL
jgi:hypothetical protein